MLTKRSADKYKPDNGVGLWTTRLWLDVLIGHFGFYHSPNTWATLRLDIVDEPPVLLLRNGHSVGTEYFVERKLGAGNCLEPDGWLVRMVFRHQIKEKADASEKQVVFLLMLTKVGRIALVSFTTVG